MPSSARIFQRVERVGRRGVLRRGAGPALRHRRDTAPPASTTPSPRSTICKEAGLTGVQLLAFPNGGGKPLARGRPFLGRVAWTCRCPSRSTLSSTADGPCEGPLLDYPKQDEKSSDDGAGVPSAAVRGARRRVRTRCSSCSPACSTVSPTSASCLAETSIGWVPFFLEIADVRYNRHIYWAEHMNGFAPLKAMPSELLNEYFYWGFQQDRSGVDLRHHLNVDHLVWAADFPHQESDWPDSDEVMEHNFTGVSRRTRSTR